MFDWILPTIFLIAAAMFYGGGTSECFRAAMTNDDDMMNRGIASLGFATVCGGIFIALVA